MKDTKPRIQSIQADATDAVGLEYIEIRASEFAWTTQDIARAIRQFGNHALQCSVNGRKMGWALFTIENGGDHIDIDRIVAYDNEYLDRVIANMLDQLCFSPKPNDTITLTTLWPEYGTDHHVFKALLRNGFKTKGLEKRAFPAYGDVYDGINLERVHER